MRKNKLRFMLSLTLACLALVAAIAESLYRSETFAPTRSQTATPAPDTKAALESLKAQGLSIHEARFWKETR